ncbi:MFS transporter [Leuconostoc sp. C2]|uniref:MFS transporter n=1 Tax=Leuconostoc sp. (strain C2) TaxID=979982 RepID=UPI0002174E58|nr:MFS transporter [Leuconostoc sp. C2]AEJ31718.1 major facilitator family transporter [Leuconostoc sp. C2]
MKKNSQISDSNYWLKIVVLNFFGWVFIYADRTVLNPIMPEIQKVFGLSNVALGMISSVFFLTYTVSQIPFARLADRGHEKWLIGLGCVFFGGMTVISGLATSFGWFLVLRALVGLGEGTFYGASFGLSSQNIPSKYLTVGLAIINSGQAIGQITGTIISSHVVLQHHIHWSIPFIIVGMPTIIVGVLYITVIHHTHRLSEEQVSTSQAKTLDKKTQTIDVLFTRQLLGTYFMLFASIYGQITMLTWLPLFLTNYRHVSGSNVAWIASIVPFIAVPSALIFARLNDKITNTRRLLLILVPISSLSLVMAVISHSQMGLVLALIVYGMTGKMTIDPMLLYTVKKNASNNQLATTFGVYNFFGMIASILAPTIMGFLMDLTGSMVIGFYFSAILLLIGIAMLRLTMSKTEI